MKGMKDLSGELRRINLALAALSRQAHETWKEAYAPNTSDRDTPKKQLMVIEKKISTLEQERALVQRAFKYETFAKIDEQEDTDGEISSYAAEHDVDLETISPEQVSNEVDQTLRERSTTRRPSVNGRRRGRPRKVQATA